MMPGLMSHRGSAWERGQNKGSEAGQSQGNLCEEELGPRGVTFPLTSGYVSYGIFCLPLKATRVGLFLCLRAKSILNGLKVAVKGKVLK